MTQDLIRGLLPLSSVPREYRQRGYRHAASWVFYGIFFAVVLGQGRFVIRQLGGSALQTVLLSIGQGLPLLPAVLWVPFVERRNPVRLTGLLLALGGTILLFTGLADTPWSLSIILTVGLMLTTLYRPVLGTALRQIYPQKWRGKLMSLPSTVDMLVRGLVLAGSGWMLTAALGTYRVLFPAAGLSLIVGALLFRGISGSRGVRRDEAASSGIDRMKGAVRQTGGNRPLLVSLVGYFLVASGGVLYGNVLPLFASDEIGLTPQQWGWALAGYLVAIVISLWLWGRFLDRFGAPLTMVLCWTAMGLAMGALFFVRTWHPFLVLVTVRGLFMSGNMLAFFPLVMHFTDSDDTMRGMGLHFSLWGLRWVTMPLVVAWVVDGGLCPMEYLFLASLALTGLGVFTMTRAWWRDRTTQPAE